jgi:branched-chain amino acid transport system permease protein
MEGIPETMDPVLLFQLIIDGLFIGGVYAIISIGLTLISGVLKLINFAHGELLMLGMYGTYWLFIFYGIDPYVSTFIVFLLLFGVGALLFHFTMRPILNVPEKMQMLMTFGLSLFLQSLAMLFWSPNYRSIQVSYVGSGLFIGGVVINFPRLIAFLLAMGFSGTFFLFLKKTKIGVAIRAATDNRDIALICGVPIMRLYLTTYGIGAAFAGIAGTVITPFYYIEPYVGWPFVITAFTIIIIGGLGNLAGAFYCSLIVGIAESLSILVLPASLKQVATFAILIIVLIFKPSGLFSR